MDDSIPHTSYNQYCKQKINLSIIKMVAGFSLKHAEKIFKVKKKNYKKKPLEKATITPTNKYFNMQPFKAYSLLCAGKNAYMKECAMQSIVLHFVHSEYDMYYVL